MRSITVQLIELDDQTAWLRHEDTMIRMDGVSELFDAAGGGGIPETEEEPAPARRPKKQRAAKEAPARGGRNKSDPEVVAKARQMFERDGLKIADIAKETGIKYATLFGIAQREGWKKP